MKNTFYTVEDVANMTGMTTRTIHNYIRRGKLKGKKIGVQWRFTEENIEALFKDEKVEEDVLDIKNNIVTQFLERESVQTSETCSVIDFVAQEKKLVDELIKQIIEFVNIHEEKGISKFSYQYFPNKNIARFIVIGDIDHINKLLNIIKRFEVEK